MSDQSTATPAAAGRRRMVNPLPFEGDGGLFYQTWYPVCLSTDVPAGGLKGLDFLDGRIVVWRGEGGDIRVSSAYCPHLGADLGVGKVVGERLRCAFHHWDYDAAGQCVKTGIGDPAPRAACLFCFPVVEKFGFVWVFNGEEELFDLPDFERPEADLVMRSVKVPHVYNCDGWIFACNTPDMQHIKVVHGITFEHDDPHKMVDWQKFGFDFRIRAGHQGGIPIDWQIGIRGTSFFRQQGTYDGWWLGGVTGHSCARPGQHEVFLCLAVERGDGSQQALDLAEERLDIASALLERTVNEDRDILDTIHYRPGTLTKGDRSLARFFNYLRAFPRAHPSADFIR